MENTGRIYFDQSIFGFLIAPASTRSVKVAQVIWKHLLSNSGTLHFGFTPGGFIESIGIQLPVPSTKIKKTLASLNGFDYAIRGLDLLTEYFLSQSILNNESLTRLAEKRLAKAKEAPFFGSELAQQTIGLMVEDDNLPDKVCRTLAWASLLQVYSPRKEEAIHGLLYLVVSSIEKSKALPAFRLGDALFWNAGTYKVNGKLTVRPRKEGKIRENGDLLDAELIQLALLGSFTSRCQKAVIVTADLEHCKQRLGRGYTFFDFLLDWSKQFPEITNQRSWNFGKVVHFGSKDESKFELFREYSVFDVVEEIQNKFGYKQKLEIP